MILMRYCGVAAGFGGKKASGNTQDKITIGLVEVKDCWKWDVLWVICILSDSIW